MRLYEREESVDAPALLSVCLHALNEAGYCSWQFINMPRNKIYLFKIRGNMKLYIEKPSYVLMKQCVYMGACQ